MKLTIEKRGDADNQKSAVSWEYRGQRIQLAFEGMARAVAVEKTERIYISLYVLGQIQEYGLSGNLLSVHGIPEKEGYQFFGLNLNDSASTGVALLYAPVNPDMGNEWGDLEQYELLVQEPVLGDFLGIYR